MLFAPKTRAQKKKRSKMRKRADMDIKTCIQMDTKCDTHFASYFIYKGSLDFGISWAPASFINS